MSRDVRKRSHPAGRGGSGGTGALRSPETATIGCKCHGKLCAMPLLSQTTPVLMQYSTFPPPHRLVVSPPGTKAGLHQCFEEFPRQMESYLSARIAMAGAQPSKPPALMNPPSFPHHPADTPTTELEVRWPSQLISGPVCSHRALNSDACIRHLSPQPAARSSLSLSLSLAFAPVTISAPLPQ